MLLLQPTSAEARNLGGGEKSRRKASLREAAAASCMKRELSRCEQRYQSPPSLWTISSQSAVEFLLLLQGIKIDLLIFGGATSCRPERRRAHSARTRY